jgi:hypothetical protein
VLASGADAPAEALERAAAREVFDLAVHELRDVTLSAEELAAYPGEYYAACTSYGITVRGGHVVLVPPDGEPHELLYQGEGRFVAREDPDLWVEFEYDEGRPIAFVLSEHGVSLRAVRVG